MRLFWRESHFRLGVMERLEPENSRITQKFARPNIQSDRTSSHANHFAKHIKCVRYGIRKIPIPWILLLHNNIYSQECALPKLIRMLFKSRNSLDFFKYGNHWAKTVFENLIRSIVFISLYLTQKCIERIQKSELCTD